LSGESGSRERKRRPVSGGRDSKAVLKKKLLGGGNLPTGAGVSKTKSVPMGVGENEHVPIT